MTAGAKAHEGALQDADEMVGITVVEDVEDAECIHEFRASLP